MAIDDLPKQGLGIVLQAYRERLGLSRRDLATLSLLSYPYLAELENGAKYPSHDALARLAAALEVSVSELELAAREAEDDQVARIDAVSSSFPSQEGGGSPDVVDQLTRDVLAEIEPAVRRAIRTALRSEQ